MVWIQALSKRSLEKLRVRSRYRPFEYRFAVRQVGKILRLPIISIQGSAMLEERLEALGIPTGHCPVKQAKTPRPRSVDIAADLDGRSDGGFVAVIDGDCQLPLSWF